MHLAGSQPKWDLGQGPAVLRMAPHGGGLGCPLQLRVEQLFTAVYVPQGRAVVYRGVREGLLVAVHAPVGHLGRRAGR